MSRPKPPATASKPTLETRFHIDLDWWERSDQDLQVTMGQICGEFEIDLPAVQDDGSRVDWVDPLTGVVVRVNQFTYNFLKSCATREDYITDRTPVVEAVFRALLGAGNRPMSPIELATRIDRPAEHIMRALSGRTIFKGIRPYHPE